MPHTITVSDATFAALQTHARPFVDSPEDAIRKLLALAAGDGGGSAAPPPTPSVLNATTFNPLTPPDLTHTKVLSIDFLGTPLAKTDKTWNGLLNQVIIAAHRKLPAFAELKKIIHVNVVPGRKDDEGYRYLKEANVSVQGQDANAAWQTAYHAAEKLGFAVDVTFVWRQKERAAHPGKTGRLIVK